MEPGEMVDLFHACDLEAMEALLDPCFLKSLSALGTRLHKEPPPRLVLAGAGTSGRLAYLLAERHRDALRRLGVELIPWIAGGPKALCLPVEGAEDDSLAAKRSLGNLLGDDGFFVGISCGLSAPAVAGGMAEAMTRGLGLAIFGTNEPRLARKDPFPGLPEGFFGVLQKAVERGDSFVLTPDTGPEALTGSSRMKGGTSTLVAFDVLFESLSEGNLGTQSLGNRIESLRSLVKESFSLNRSSLVDALRAAGKALREGGQVLYWGKGEAGLAGVLDASECTPTFGAEPNQVRAYLEEGWGAYRCLDEDQRKKLTASFPLRMSPALIGSGEKPLFALLLGGAHPPSSLSNSLEKWDVSLLRVDLADLLPTKLFLNSLSTGAFVLAGKVYQNRMIDLQLSNSKLFQRAQRIVADLAGVPQSEALRSIVGAIHGVYPPSVALLRLPVEAHLQIKAHRVVPTAVLLARGLDLAEAKQRLEKEPRVGLLME